MDLAIALRFVTVMNAERCRHAATLPHSHTVFFFFFEQCSQETCVGEQSFVCFLLLELLKACVGSQTFGGWGV